MPRIHFIDNNGTEREVDAEVDVSLMQVALANSIPGIAAECGGCCLCATCHARIDNAWVGLLPYPSSNEVNMLDHIPNARLNSRLTCKIWVTEELDGLIVRTL
jgi:ferredoxin, 2Fe-2S